MLTARAEALCVCAVTVEISDIFDIVQGDTVTRCPPAKSMGTQLNYNEDTLEAGEQTDLFHCSINSQSRLYLPSRPQVQIWIKGATVSVRTEHLLEDSTGMCTRLNPSGGHQQLNLYYYYYSYFSQYCVSEFILQNADTSCS